MANIIRGTTPTLRFKIPFEQAIIKVAYITFEQNGKDILEKSTNDENVELTDELITIKMSQEDTLAFSNINGKAEMQIRILLTDDTAVASKIYKVSVDRILKEGVISG